MEIATRGAVESDYPAFVRLFGELGIPDPIPSVDKYVEKLMPMMLVADADGTVVGYATWRAYGTTVHVPNVAVDPAWRGRRIGQLLLERIRDAAKQAGCTRWYLNVKADNAPAIRLYERCGFAVDKESWALAMPWTRVLALSFDPGLASAEVRPDEDADIATRFGLELERVAVLRARSASTVLLAVHAPDGGGPVAFAAFDTGFPGAYPFKTLRPDLAGNLLRACHARAELDRFDYIRLTVEGDRPLYEALVAGGAQLTFALLQLASPL
jgi:GNAT superfamily N-acetyltransferase